jgi:nicotinate-nucleotide pyrophosphorylase (carboxylating)
VTPEIRAALVAVGLDPAAVDTLATRAIEEDLDGGVDVTSVATIPFDAEASGVFVPRQAGVVAGILVAAAVVQAVGDNDVIVEPLVADGSVCAPGDLLLRVRGLTRTLLTAERTALNLLCHLSGVATATARWVELLDGTGTKVRDTRKTTPGLRALEKYAVRCGGGVNHRMSLSDAALVKDNHVLAAGGVAKAFTSVRTTFPDLPVEVECDTVDQVREAVDAGADLVLLDNMSVDELAASVAIARPAGVRTEASGGLSPATVRAAAETGVDFVAVGALTHSAPVLDIGLDLEVA